MPDPEGHPSAEEMQLGTIFSALADPLRRGIVRLLAAEPPGSERACGSFGLPVTKATRTHHFRVLREAGLIFQTDLGNRKTTRLRRAELDARFPGLIDLLVANG
ncbi:ArsR/SmtB family transcription factor [Phreatobacter stygius]|uniref:Helix-turn-helix transcriptional regulator n=1 Tax=Phreatobacter stygius TaxID=1940610 RepID=A0A4D7APN6_9HYPH|nr:helix-turn-helix domain-containing protein [Phreatobacter stygius]QCI62949.1 helix-turn-helix transcriptional regulator [Phreatobacter stygius]